MLAILCTDGQLELSHLVKECLNEHWAPVLAYQDGSRTVIPVFHDSKTAQAFIRRNLPKEWVRGGIFLTENDVLSMKEKGWHLQEMSFPRKMSDLVKFSLEIHNFVAKPELKVSSC